MSRVSSDARKDKDSIDGDDNFLVDESDLPLLEQKAKDADQGYGMYISHRIRLSNSEMTQLQNKLTEKLCKELPRGKPFEMCLSIEPTDIQALGCKLDSNSKKLQNVPVVIEKLSEGRVLVKVGPHDLSGVGGHQIREKIVKHLVNKALIEWPTNNSPQNNYNYQNVNVSASLGVRGRMQMLFGLFTRKAPGSHQNAYIKVATEENWTHWEPRKGPQSFFNDTICAMATTVMLALFEYGLKVGKIKSAPQASQKILRSGIIKKTFDQMLNKKQDRVTYLVDTINNEKEHIVSDTPRSTDTNRRSLS